MRINWSRFQVSILTDEVLWILARERYTPEAIIRKLRQTEVLQGQGKTVPEDAEQLGSPSRPSAAGARNAVIRRPARGHAGLITPALHMGRTLRIRTGASMHAMTRSLPAQSRGKC